jgi:hypothetical protein
MQGGPPTRHTLPDSTAANGSRSADGPHGPDTALIIGGGGHIGTPSTLLTEMKMLTSVHPDGADSMAHQHPGSRSQQDATTVENIPYNHKKVRLPNMSTQSPGLERKQRCIVCLRETLSTVPMMTARQSLSPPLTITLPPFHKRQSGVVHVCK